MDEISLYKRALSASEIKAIYQAGSAGKFAAASTMLPYLDTDQDGIPDFWEITFGQNPTNASNNQLSTNPNYFGYSDLEEYLNWLAIPHALTVTNTPVGVDLYLLSGESGNLSFSVTNAVNGSVYLTNVLGSVTNTGPFSNSIAIFTPLNKFSGYASFDYYVTNNDTVAYFGPVTVSVVVSAVPIVYATNLFNSPPMLATNLPDLTNNELTTLTVTNTATDTNAGVTLTYTVTMAIDTNAMIANGWPLTYATTIPAPVIDANGIITWTPSEAQGPGVYIITTVVSDNGIPPGTATNSFIVTVEEVNTAPVLPAQTNLTIGALTTLIVTNTATDSDIPPNPLTYQLIGPLGAVIDTNGIITWTPTLAQAPGVYTFTTIVTDTNQYALFNQTFECDECLHRFRVHYGRAFCVHATRPGGHGQQRSIERHGHAQRSAHHRLVRMGNQHALREPDATRRRGCRLQCGLYDQPDQRFGPERAVSFPAGGEQCRGSDLWL